MLRAKPGDHVKVNYTGKLKDGTMFDSSVNREPLRFVLGEGDIIPGFENAVLGMSPGETKTETIPFWLAYGPRLEELVVTVERDRLPMELIPHVGQELELRNEEGKTSAFVITDVNDTSVTLDGNHPLAGKDLIFDIELLEIAPEIKSV
jgi:peptidylprolyl isomerase